MMLLLVLLAQAVPEINPERYLLVQRDRMQRVEMPVVTAIPPCPRKVLQQERPKSVLLHVEFGPSGFVERVTVLDFDDATAREAARKAAEQWRLASSGSTSIRHARLEFTFRPVAGGSDDSLLSTVHGEVGSYVVDGKGLPCPRYVVTVPGRIAEGVQP